MLSAGRGSAALLNYDGDVQGGSVHVRYCLAWIVVRYSIVLRFVSVRLLGRFMYAAAWYNTNRCVRCRLARNAVWLKMACTLPVRFLGTLYIPQLSSYLSLGALASERHGSYNFLLLRFPSTTFALCIAETCR